MRLGKRAFVAAGIATAVLIASALPARALYLDKGRVWKVSGNFYTQTRLRMQESDAPEDLEGGGTNPNAEIGQLIQWRNYAFPVVEGDMRRAFGFRWVDDLSFRLAGRFIYDGIYDFGASQYRKALRRALVSSASLGPNAGFAPGGDPNAGPGLGGNEPVAIYQGTERVERNEQTRIGACGPAPAILVLPSPITCQLANPDERAARLADQEIFNLRDQFAQQVDPWEIYVNFEKRPLFLRIGKQALAWGESDGQRLLDGINPLDRLFGLPFDEDIDEQRIPLWMIRGNLQLVDSLGPLASFGVEGFFVPGIIDTTQNPVPLGGTYPYAPPAGCDPQFLANEKAQANFGGSRPAEEGCTRSNPGLIKRGTIKTSLYERIPEKKWENSRYGVRILGILFGNYTFSLGAYRSWADVPQPRVHYTDLLLSNPLLAPDDPLQATPPLPTAVIAELTHGTVTVIGGTLSFFQPRLLPGVVRSEVGYFMDEPALVPIANFGHIPLLPDFLPVAKQKVFIDTFVPTADYLRWVIGYDMFQVNVPWISRTNNIIIVSQWFNSLRLTGDARYRNMVRDANGTGAPLDPNLGTFDFGVANPDGSRINSPKYQSLGNITFQAFMMHGLLVPQITFVGDIEGWGAVLPNVTYRVTDNFLVKVGYSAIFGSFFGGGIFRDRDQVGVRVTYQVS
jgi:hypothetical protein